MSRSASASVEAAIALRAYAESERGVDSEGRSFDSFDAAIDDLERKVALSRFISAHHVSLSVTDIAC